MKVCLVYDFLTEYGGIERLMVNHARMLQEQGIEVEILTCYYDKKVLEKMGFGNIKVTNISSIKMPSEFLSLVLCFLGFNKLKKISSDLIMSYSFPSNFLIRNLQLKKIDYMNHVPRFLYMSTNDRWDWAKSTPGLKRPVSFILSLLFNEELIKLDKKLVNKNKLVFTNSSFTKAKIDPIYKIKSIVSYPPVDPVFTESKSKINKKFILCSGRIIPDKKFDWLIEICSMMKNKIPLYLSGQCNDSYKKELQRLAKRKNVKLKFLGRLSTDNLVKYYSSAEVFAFPVPLCDYGLVPIECLSCGTPVVLWGDGGGQAEQVVNGKNGYYAKPYNLNDFAKKIDFCIDNKFKNEHKTQIVKLAHKFAFATVKKGFIREIKKILY
jgi:glycosyltransferase involved in cell wall biosynthesis